MPVPVACAPSRDGQVKVPPTLSLFLHSPPLFSSTIFLILKSIFFPPWSHSSFSSQVIFADTSVPPLQLSSQCQSLDTHHSFQVMSLASEEDCFTLPRAYRVKIPLSCNHARGTVHVRSPVSRFHARRSYSYPYCSYQYHFNAVRGRCQTSVCAASHATLVHSALRSICTH